MINKEVVTDPGYQKRFDLEDRLIAFACLCLEICDLLPETKAGVNLEYQLSKSSTASALIYGEAKAAESPADFQHKLKCVLKEIRESSVNLKIINRKPLVVHPKVDQAMQESEKLSAIFRTSIATSKRNNSRLRTSGLVISLFIILYFLFLISQRP